MHALTTNGLMILNHSKDMRDKLSVDRFYEAQLCPKVIYELTSDTTRTLIGPKGKNLCFIVPVNSRSPKRQHYARPVRTNN